MNTFNLILLIVAHIICGLGVMGWFSIRQNPFVQLSMAAILGVMIHSMVPAALDMMHIRLTPDSVGWSIVIVTLLCAISLLRRYRDVLLPIKEFRWRFQVYELPALLTLAFILYLSVWRCYFFPVTPRDMLSGPETLAQLAIQEGTVFNSFFKIDLATTNNHLKSPFMTGIQIIYKMFVQDFGQLWLSVIVVSFIVMLYTWLKQYLNPLIGGLLLLLFVATPESFAYTFMALFDYSNMVLFAIGAYCLWKYLKDGRANHFWMSALSFGLATYLRTETLILVGFFVPLLIWDWYRKKYQVKKLIFDAAALLLMSFLFYFLVMNIYIKGFIPVVYDVSQNINPNLLDISLFFERFSAMNSDLIFSERGQMLWNNFIYLFLLLLAAELLAFRRVTADGRFWLYAVLVVYIGLPFIGYLLPLADVSNTTKRGLFKILPLMLLYMRHNQVLLWLSNKVDEFTSEEKVIVAQEKTIVSPKTRNKKR